jgi:hypothetical protein
MPKLKVQTWKLQNEIFILFFNYTYYSFPKELNNSPKRLCLPQWKCPTPKAPQPSP